MNPNVPFYLNFFFILTTLYGIWLFKKAFNPSKMAWKLLFLWLGFQAVLAYSGFYENNNSVPPKFALAVAPALLFIAAVFLTKKGKLFIEGLELEPLHWIHTIRVPVEIILWLLFIAREIPQIMTFEGRNFDILAGLTAPLIVYYGIRKPIIDKNRMLLWNALSLFLLVNVVATAILSLETPFQQLKLEIPTRAVLYFPFVWLPSFIVPMVLFSHLVSLSKLLRKNAD